MFWRRPKSAPLLTLIGRVLAWQPPDGVLHVIHAIPGTGTIQVALLAECGHGDASVELDPARDLAGDAWRDRLWDGLGRLVQARRAEHRALRKADGESVPSMLD